MLEKLKLFIVWHLPKWMIYWSTVRAGVSVIKDYECPSDLKYFEIIQRM